MVSRQAVLVLVLFGFVLSACGEPTIDTSTDEGIEERNLEVVRRMITAADQGDFGILEQVWSPDIVVHFGATDVNGDAALQLMESVAAAFPDMRHEVEDMFATKDKVVLRGNIVATHQGEFQGIAATGRSVAIGQIVIFRLEDGRIVEYWEQADFLGLMQQLGALPAS